MSELKSYDEMMTTEKFAYKMGYEQARQDLLANGQRVEPDYHAGAEVLLTHNPDARIGGMTLDDIRQIVDAAIAGLSLYPKEAENEN